MASCGTPRHRLRLQRAEGRFAVLMPLVVSFVELLHSGWSLASDGTGFLRATATTRRREVFVSSLFGRVGGTRTRFISTLDVRSSTLEMPTGRERIESWFDWAALVGFASVIVVAAAFCRARPLTRLALLPLLLFSGSLRVVIVSRGGCGDGPSRRREHEERVPVGRLFEDMGVGVVLLGGRAHAELLLNVRAHQSIVLLRSRVPLSVRARSGVAGGLGDPAGERRRARDRKDGLERDRDWQRVRSDVAGSVEIYRRLLEVDRDRSGEWTSSRRRRSLFGWSHVALFSALGGLPGLLERVGTSSWLCSSA